MYRILVPIDRDEDRAIAQAEAIRRLPDAAASIYVTVLHVFEDDEEARSTEPNSILGVARFTDQLAEHGISHDVERRSGDPPEEILEVADDIAADMILLGGRKRSPLGSLIFGSVCQAVILDARRPVTVTGAEIKQDPSHRCTSCGETYYTDSELEITSCRNCGGAGVEPHETVHPSSTGP